MFSIHLTTADVKALVGFLLAGSIVGIASATVRILKDFGGIEVLF